MPGVSARRRSGAHTVALLTGYGVSLSVDHGALVLRDGIANQRRQTRLHRGQRTLKRIVVLSATGNLSLAALRWCARVCFVTLAPSGCCRRSSTGMPDSLASLLPFHPTRYLSGVEGYGTTKAATLPARVAVTSSRASTRSLSSAT